MSDNAVEQPDAADGAGERGAPQLSAVFDGPTTMARLKHELWREADGEQTLCLAGPMGNGARALLSPGAQLIWTVEGDSHFDVMSKCYAYMGWGEYHSKQEVDRDPYPDAWLAIQSGRDLSK